MHITWLTTCFPEQKNYRCYSFVSLQEKKVWLKAVNPTWEIFCDGLWHTSALECNPASYYIRQQWSNCQWSTQHSECRTVMMCLICMLCVYVGLVSLIHSERARALTLAVETLHTLSHSLLVLKTGYKGWFLIRKKAKYFVFNVVPGHFRKILTIILLMMMSKYTFIHSFTLISQWEPCFLNLRCHFHLINALTPVGTGTLCFA